MRIGIDLGGTKIEGVLLDSDGKIRQRLRIDTPQGDYNATLESIGALVGGLGAKLDPSLGVGIGIPGTLDRRSGLVKNANSTCLIGKPLDHDLEQLLQRPVRLANDADCFTLSEHIDGAAKGSNVTFGVILGTGVGGGIALGQSCLSGPNGICGEWGHNPMPWAEPEDAPISCYCGLENCIETYLSGPGLVRRFALRFPQRETAGLDAKALFARAREGDCDARFCVGQYHEQLAKALASVINLLDPEVIVLGGGLSNEPSLYQEIPRRWARYVFSTSVETELKAAQHGDSSGVRGAAWLWPQ